MIAHNLRPPKERFKNCLPLFQDFGTQIIKSPLNYIGGKYKLLSQILPLFPKKVDTGIDLFCGGGNVGINLEYENIIFNDNCKPLMDIYRLFKNNSFEKIIENIFQIIQGFKLSHSAKYGYEFYGCNGAKGLSEYNKESFLRLRKSYNEDREILKLFVLIVFAFNNQIRFNSKGDYNLPCGKRDFNVNMQRKLEIFMKKLKNKDIALYNQDFREFDISLLDCRSFVYIDPPYFLGNAPYNENNCWSQKDEFDLLEFLNNLDSKRIKFALSNTLYHKNKEHKILKEWLKKYPKFNIYPLNFHYKNCNYQTKQTFSEEVLITNYREF